MTPADFRAIALSLPETVEAEHMGHPDFRVGGKVFATLGYPRAGWAMVKLPPVEQEAFVRLHPGIFTPVKGAWGEAGATNIILRSARSSVLRAALMAAWQARAPRRLREPR
jgi:hypothetical protein